MNSFLLRLVLGQARLCAAPADYLDTADLKAVAAGGLVNEDVMQKIWDISFIPLPFTDLVDEDTCDNSYTEWTKDKLQAVNLNNAVVSGSDSTGAGNQNAGGPRVGNHCQNSIKDVRVTERAQNTNNIGMEDTFEYQLMMRNRELHQDVEAIAQHIQASVQDDGNATAGKVGSFYSWLTTNVDRGAGGANGGFQTGSKLVNAPTVGARRAFTMTMLKALVVSVYKQNGTPTTLTSVADLIQGLNTFMLANPANARIAVPTANVQGTGSGVEGTAQGFINRLITDFGFVLDILPNRLQQTYLDSGAAAACNVGLIDPTKAAIAFLKNYTTKPLGKKGLSDQSQISVDWTVKVYNEEAHAVAADINPTAAVTA